MDLFHKKTEERGFISKETILKYVSEEDIFELVFEFKPEEFTYVTSPFREDRSPNCWFSKDYGTGKLRFVDFGNSKVINGVNMTNIDCFDAVRVFFNLSNHYTTLRFIQDTLIKGKDLPERAEQKPLASKDPNHVEIYISIRNFNLLDKAFWQDKYEIVKQSLIEDKVFPIYQCSVFNSRHGDYIIDYRDHLAYAYTDFDDGRKKIYCPTKSKKGKFVTNCFKDDIGGIKSLAENGSRLIITKSYKDWRVLKNLGQNVLWVQSEGIIPSLEILLPICNRFDSVIIFFDNDEPGLVASEKLETIINSFIPGKAQKYNLPINLMAKGITDPSDFVEIFRREGLIQILTEHRILI